MLDELLTMTEQGLYCPAGDFHIDPWRAVRRAVITHAHSDHARPGSDRYLAVTDSRPLLRMRLGSDVRLDDVPYGQQQTIGSVRVSFHPAGHMLGAAQVRLEKRGYVAVVSGDYKRAADPTCPTFVPLRCHAFVTEATFGLPIYRWPPADQVIEQVQRWWRENQQAGRTSVLYAYAIGKAQRLLASLEAPPGPIFLHGAIARGCRAYLAAGAMLPPTRPVLEAPADTNWQQALILAPPSVHGTPWLRRFEPYATAIASGWMRVRGVRRRRGVDHGFVLSDHVDWDALLQTIDQTEAETVWATHGSANVVVRYLREQGRIAQTVETPFRGESIDEPAPEDTDDPSADGENPAAAAGDPPRPENASKDGPREP